MVIADLWYLKLSERQVALGVHPVRLLELSATKKAGREPSCEAAHAQDAGGEPASHVAGAAVLWIERQRRIQLLLELRSNGDLGPAAFAIRAQPENHR